LLHDAAEDAGGRVALDRIRDQFGDRVASLVAALSDTLDPDDRRSWRARKTAYLAHLPDITDDAVLRVALADKVHNARSIVRDYRAEGHALWERFTNKTAEDQLWYYGQLLEFFAARGAAPLVEDLDRAVSELAELIAQDPHSPKRE
jgi:(p)ppGpp synthase/HD superfamily hydrolase